MPQEFLEIVTPFQAHRTAFVLESDRTFRPGLQPLTHRSERVCQKGSRRRRGGEISQQSVRGTGHRLRAHVALRPPQINRGMVAAERPGAYRAPAMARNRMANSPQCGAVIRGQTRISNNWVMRIHVRSLIVPEFEN